MTTSTEIPLEFPQHNFNLSLILATLWIINNDLAKYTTSALAIGQYAINQRNRMLHNDLINEIIKRAMTTPNIKIFTEGEVEENELNRRESESDLRGKDEFLEKNFSHDKCIWFLDTITSYKNFERDLLNPQLNYHRSGIFLLIYTGTEPERLNNVKEIFRRLFNLYSTNVNVMLVVGTSPYLYTYFPFAVNKCQSSMPEFYISFRDIQRNFSAFEVKKPIFPSKVNNMYGCELAVATWEYPPYIMIDKDPKTGKLKSLHGVEGLLLSLLGELMNFKIRITAPVPPARGDVYRNGTATGATKMVINAEANITIIAYMYNEIRAEAMQASFSYLYIPFVLAIPEGRKMSSFERLMKPFRYIIWSCFSSSILFGIICIYYVRFLGRSKLMDFVYGQGNRIPFTNLIAVLFGVTVHGNFPFRNFARYIFLIFLLYTFLLRSAYSGALYILLQDGRSRNTFKSINEIVERNYTIYAFPATVDVLKLSVPEANTKLIDPKYPTTTLFKRISSSGNEKIALCMLEYTIREYNQQNPNNQVKILDQPLLTAPIAFYMPRHTYMRHRADDLILRILAAGLIKHYESYYLYSSQQPEHTQKEPVKLSFHLLLALFCVYIVLLLFAFGIFLLELASKKSAWCRIVIDFLNI